MSWAHPEFGQILATCSFDRTVSVWEETVGEKTTPTMTPVKRWLRRANLVDSRTNVTDVKFGPKHQGLLLASASVDGIIRVYEALDIMNLGQWTLAYDIPCKLPLSCITWNNSMFRLHAPMIAVGFCLIVGTKKSIPVIIFYRSGAMIQTQALGKYLSLSTAWVAMENGLKAKLSIR